MGIRRFGVAVATVALAGPLAVAPPASSASPAATPNAAKSPERERAHPAAVPAGSVAAVLGSGWRSSKDRAWTTVGDSDGLHVLVAEADERYRWRTVASLTEPGFDTDRWIGNACVTGSGSRAVVVYAPRMFVNKPELFARGAFAAVVDLGSGKVTKLPVQTSLAYFNPGCGAGEKVLLTQGGGEDKAATRIIAVNARSGKLAKPIKVGGQVTSPVRVNGRIVAAAGAGLARITRGGTVQRTAKAASVPFHVHADADGGVVFMDRQGESVTVRRAKGSKVRELARGRLGRVGLRSGSGGRVALTGDPVQVRRLPASVRALDVPVDSQVSTRGEAAVTRVGRTKPSATGIEGGRVNLAVRVTRTGRSVDLSVRPGATRGRNPASAIKWGAKRSRGRSGTLGSPVDADRFCSVPRNSLSNQVLQPKPRQVEWAVDQAVRGALTLTREADWKDLGMPSYTPQGLFPRRGLSGGGYIPAQIMLGVATQESNLWQASRHALPGETGNPLIGNFYGRDIYNKTPNDDWDIRWSEADCGYGVTQLTDGMRLPGKEKKGKPKAMPYQKQRAVALDFGANIAAGVRLLEHKWNQTRNAGLVVHNGNPAKLENWFYAVWAYNSGFYPDKGNGSPWGVGWFNNPVNPIYPASRGPFLEYTYEDARRPQDWPYPEKVMGWAGHPIESEESPGNYVHGYRAAWWNSGEYRKRVKPHDDLFCDESNKCYPGEEFPNDMDEPPGPCSRRDLKCWYHKPASWKVDCDYRCGNELLRFDPGYPYQGDGNSYPPVCNTNGLPSGALIVDDIPNSAPRVRPCNRPHNDGSFSLAFASDSAGKKPSKIDFHQLGGGFGGHYWFGYARGPEHPFQSKLKVTGTWTLGQSLSGWARVMVHIPDHRGKTQQAKYEINLGSGWSSAKARYLPQGRGKNRWASLGVYKFTGTPKVRLSTSTHIGEGVESVAFDAIAFQPLPRKPKHIVAVLGDSYTSGEGAGTSAQGTQDYDKETDTDHGTPWWNACRRSLNAWPRKVVLPGQSATLKQLAENWSKTTEFAFVACSGAATKNVWNAGPGGQPHDEGQFREQNQVKSGALGQNTTLVMLTLGGNDEGAFGKVMQECGTPGNCAKEDFLRRHKDIIDRTIPRLRVTLQDVARKAPNAQIVLMGYPEPFSRTIKCSGSWYFDESEVDAIAELVHYNNSEQRKMAAALRGVKVEYADPVNAFVGHGGCDENEWINKIVAGPNGDGDFHDGDPATPLCIPLTGPCLSRESFHPNRYGQAGYAGVMRQRLIDIGYSGGP